MKTWILLITTVMVISGCVSTQNGSPAIGPITGKKYVYRSFHFSQNDIYNRDNYNFLGNEYRNECRKYFVNQNSDMSKEYANSILKGNVIAGMNKNQVVASIGTPYKIEQTVYLSQKYEQWIYDDHSGHPFTYDYLYFDKDILIGFQKNS